MAFTVTPTSGAQPYILSANIANSQLIDGVNYYLTVKHSTSSTSCNPIGSAQELTPVQIESLVNGNNVSITSSVNAGYCRTYTLTILKVSDDTLVDISSVFVDNI